MADDSFVGGLSIPHCSGECEKRSSNFFDLVFDMLHAIVGAGDFTYFCLNAIQPIFIYFANPIYLSFYYTNIRCAHSRNHVKYDIINLCTYKFKIYVM